MMAALKAEFRKLWTVRSTYFILAFVLFIAVFFGFYVSGWKIDQADLHNPATLALDVTSAISAVSVFASLIGVLLVTHEYRYNTIMYTLTAANSRSKVLLAKSLVVSGFAVVFALCLVVLSPVLSVLGAHAHHLTLVPQTLHYGDLLWRSLFFCWGYAMAGLIIASLIRSQVGAIVVLFIAPSTLEGLLGLLLKKNVVYLPFSSLSTVIGQGMNYNNSITPQRGALVFTGYLVVSGTVAWILFLRRDAN
jgi:ABC-type transport system involved in multi-copper enzyme maturation permease subunit